MKLKFLFLIFVSLFLLPFGVEASCTGAYNCGTYNSITGICNPLQLSGSGFCSGPNSACGTYAALHCPGQCVMNNNCGAECSYSLCSPNDGHSCPAGSLWIDLGGTGQISCTGSTGCFTSPGCTVPTATPVPSCGTCNPGPSCPPACGGQCGGTCSGNGQACTIFGPPCGSTPTPTPANCTIQGRKMIMPNNNQSAPAIGQSVSLSGGGSSTANPYSFSVAGNGSYTVTAANISGYDTGYTVCTNSTACHTLGAQQNPPTINDGNSATVTCPAGQYVDLWWHYSPVKTCTVSLSSATITAGQSTTVTMNGSGQAASEPVRLFVSRTDGLQVSPNNFSPAATEAQGAFGQYFYRFDASQCSSSNYASCQSVTSITVPTAGSYRVHCDLSTSPNLCSGNPFCTMNGGANDCSPWVSCSANDSRSLTVNSAPTITPIPTDGTCQVTTNPLTLQVVRGGPTGAISASVTSGQGGASITNMAFSSGTGAVASVSPVNDPSFPYGTNATGLSAGTSLVTATASLSDGRNCASLGTLVTVVNPTPTNTPIPTATPTSAPGCNVTVLPVSATVNPGSTTALSVTTSGVVGTVNDIKFTTSDGTVATVAPASDTTSPYGAVVSGVVGPGGTSTITATCYLVGSTGTPRGSDTSVITVPTPTPTSVSAKTWTITTSPVCQSGGGVTSQVKMFRYIGPTTAPVYTEDALAVGNHSMVITSNVASDVVWVGMKNSGGTSYEPISVAPAAAAMTFGQDFSPAVWTSQWTRAALNAGSYTLNMEVVPTAPGAPSGLSSSVVGNQADLNWSAPGSWGVACASNNTYKLYLSQEAAGYSGYPQNPQCNQTSCNGTPTATGLSSSSSTQTVAPGSRYCWTVRANNGNLDGAPAIWNCFDSVAVPWWQAVGGEAVGATGSLTATVPSGEYLIDKIGTGLPGIPFGTSLGGNLSRTTGNLNEQNWWVNLTGFDWSAALAKPENSYTSMRNRILNYGASTPVANTLDLNQNYGGSAVTINGQSYRIFESNGDLGILPGALANRKVIVLMNGAANSNSINGNVTLSGTGFLLVLSEGDLQLANTVTAIQGIFYSGGVFRTGAAANVLNVTGSVIGMQGVQLTRTGGVGTNPSEIFTFSPALTAELSGIGLRKKVLQELVNP